MTKNEAIRLFGDVGKLAAALGITRHAIYQWPDVLKQRAADEIRGAAVRLGKLPVTQNKIEPSCVGVVGQPDRS